MHNRLIIDNNPPPPTNKLNLTPRLAWLNHYTSNFSLQTGWGAARDCRPGARMNNSMTMTMDDGGGNTTLDGHHHDNHAAMITEDAMMMEEMGDHHASASANHHTMSSWSQSQQIQLAIWPHVTGLLSVISSSLIILLVLRRIKNKRAKVYHRLLLAMSLVDVNTSFWYFLSTWPIPRNTPNIFATVGTTGSCTAQGFFIQFGIATPIYNAALSFYYMLIIRYQWKEQKLQNAEKYLHALPILWAACTSFAALGMGILGNASLWCWIVHTAGKQQWIFFYGPLWSTMIFSAISYSLAYGAVLKTEIASARWKSKLTSSEQVNNSFVKRKVKKADDGRKFSKQVSSQALCYMLAFCECSCRERIFISSSVSF